MVLFCALGMGFRCVLGLVGGRCFWVVVLRVGRVVWCLVVAVVFDGLSWVC